MENGRTHKNPSVDDSFLWRICHALDEPPPILAKNIGVPYADLKPLLDGQRFMLAEIDREQIWWLIMEHVSKRLGSIMAVRSELDRALQKDRMQRVQRVKKIRAKYDEHKATDTDV
jgi:hypothetical protein